MVHEKGAQCPHGHLLRRFPPQWSLWQPYRSRNPQRPCWQTRSLGMAVAGKNPLLPSNPITNMDLVYHRRLHHHDRWPRNYGDPARFPRHLKRPDRRHEARCQPASRNRSRRSRRRRKRRHVAGPRNGARIQRSQNLHTSGRLPLHHRRLGLPKLLPNAY